MSYLASCIERIAAEPVQPASYGRISSVVGMLIEASHLNAALGDLCEIYDAPASTPRMTAEVVGLRGATSLLLPLGRSAGLEAGHLVRRSSNPLSVQVGESLLGRIVDSNGRPIDDRGPILATDAQLVHADPPPALKRHMVTERMRTGVRSIDAFTTLGRGQRVGIFAGSGVGKSTLLGMIARQAEADVNVIALIGERSREVQEFIVDNLGEEGLHKSVVVAVTGDQAAMSRVKGAFVATAIAEYFRDRGKNVLLMMDSVTRVAMAQREIGLAVGEPPTTRGYTPSVFTILPQLLERAGPGTHGSITGIFTVLVDGDDMNDPVADAARGILDGHIVLSRKLAHANHFPAIDVLQSVSRVMTRVSDKGSIASASNARSLLASYREVEDLIRVGAYVEGSDARADRAIKANEGLRAFLTQGTSEVLNEDAHQTLNRLMQ
ncbi:MAG: FliI/YscN family ATPase [Rhodothermales bacterium]|nr:FliI/YscN family ATPase [Rhodothermales bacterium]MBO6780457.1 FliI/YscN family ATPase [Rhodothermales bacterium]